MMRMLQASPNDKPIILIAEKVLLRLRFRQAILR